MEKYAINETNELSLIITLPSDIEWSDYQKELLAAATGQILNFKVPNFPTNVGIGDKCYVVHRGYIIGWQNICGFSEKEFTCTTTGKKFKGKFIERTGQFNYLDMKLPYKGFQGYRYFSMNEYLKELDSVTEEIDVPSDCRFYSEDRHAEVPAGTYKGWMSGWSIHIKYNGEDIYWKSKNGGIRGRNIPMSVNVTDNGYAYI